jgi:hypothetical protein
LELITSRESISHPTFRDSSTRCPKTRSKETSSPSLKITRIKTKKDKKAKTNDME